MTANVWIGVVATVMLLAVASPASADPPLGIYFGGGVGWSNVTVEDDDDCCYYYDDYGYDYDEGDEDTGFSAHVGYRFLPYFAAEIGYVDAGTPQWDARYVYVPDLDDVFDTSVDLEIQAAQLSGLGILPFGRIWEVYARAGVAYWWADADQRLVRTFDGALFERAIDDEGATFLFGIGIGVSPTPAWHMRLEFQSFAIEEDLLAVNDDSTLDSILIEAQFRTGG